MSSIEYDKEAMCVANFLITLASKFGVTNDAPFASRDLKAIMIYDFMAPLILLLITGMSHPKTDAH